MNPLKILLTMLFLSFCSTLSIADNVHFKFTHIASPEDAGFPVFLLPTLYVVVKKENGVHKAVSYVLTPGSFAEDDVKSSLFAGDVTGTYNVNVWCIWSKEVQYEFTGKLDILPTYNNKTILIQASCPMHSFKTNEFRSPLSNVFITLPGSSPLPLSMSLLYISNNY